MAHFAKLDENNLVIAVNVVNNVCLNKDDEENSGIDFLTNWSNGYANWKQTSYNATFRKNYAAVDYFFSEHLDAFIPPQCHDEAILDENTCQWLCPAEIHHAETLA